MKKAILFGANGYLGRHIAYFLKQTNLEFIPIDIAEKSVDSYSNYQQIDITEKNQLSRIDFDVDYVFAFAGLTGTGNSPEIVEQFTKVNELGLLNIIEKCEEFSSVRLIFPSTRLVYKGIENTFLKEDSEKETKTIYAENKINCEILLANSKVDYSIFRIFVPYGNLIDDEYSYGTIGFFINKAKSNNNITLFGDGSLKRTFTHIEDISNIILESLKNGKTKNNVYNIGSNDALSLLEVANLVASRYNVGVEFFDWPEEALKIESGDTIFSDEKLQKVINYKYQNSLSEWVSNI